MDILQYADLDSGGLKPQMDRTVLALQRGDFRGADAKKLQGTSFYRAKLNDTDRLLFRFVSFQERTYLLLLEIIRNHAYHKSRFLNGAAVEEAKMEPLADLARVPAEDRAPIPYVNPEQPQVHILDKIISFDDYQRDAFHHPPPVILIGPAGSGKTVLTLEKIKRLSGDVLYVTHSAFLAENSRNMYYGFDYENERQNVEFLCFQEFLETLRVPPGKPMTARAFQAWFARHRHSWPIKDAHRLFEEFQGVITGCAVNRPFLPREEYLALGVRRSIFSVEERPGVYDIFTKFREFVNEGGFYDMNEICFSYQTLCRPRYDFVVVDEVQDITNAQLFLILKALRIPGQFILCGDSNQIVHPNFFSWAQVKTLFFEQAWLARREALRVLNNNFRNSPEVTELANRLLRIKVARFGSIDRESNYLVKPVCGHRGRVELIEDAEAVRKELNAKTRRSTQFAVLVLREEDKAEARRLFQTPLLFSIQEAKGLEYENVILLNFVSANSRLFRDLTDGVSPDRLAGELTYARAADKTDKSLEGFKFYINALYVAITRTMRNLFLLEQEPRHALFSLLGIEHVDKQSRVQAQDSSLDEWKREARKLELQGKQDQADDIRRRILTVQPVPWNIISPDSLEALKRDALNPARFNKQAKSLLFEYALEYDIHPLFQALVKLDFNRALHPERERAAARQKYTRDYLERSLNELQRKLSLYGTDFRDPLNRTPLMLAASLGMRELIEKLSRDGADPTLRDAAGRMALHIALREAYRAAHYARDSIGQLYSLLAPTSTRVKIRDRLVKIDRHTMEFFLLHSMLAQFQDIVRVKIHYRIPAFETADFVHALEHFPDHVIPDYRKKRPYLSSVLAKNEVFRKGPWNRGLFVRVTQGFYILNPCMELDINGTWTNVYALLNIQALRQEKDNAPLQKLLEAIENARKDILEMPAEPEPCRPAPPVPAPPASPAADIAGDTAIPLAPELKPVVFKADPSLPLTPDE